MHERRHTTTPPNDGTSVIDWQEAAKGKPTLRGVSHVLAFFFSLISGARLVLMAPPGTVLPVLLYCTCFSLVFGVSGLLHYPNWNPKTRKFLRQLDHSMIFLLISSTYSLCLILPDGSRLLAILSWIGAIIGIACKFLLFHRIEKAPKMVTAVPYAILGWLSVIELPSIAYYIEYVTIYGVVLMAFGGLCYTLGAVCYSMKRPNLIPGVFGYHELLHVFVIVANYCFYITVEILIRSWWRIHGQEVPL